MSAFIHNVTFDASDPRRLGRFWSQVTGYAVGDEREAFVMLRAPDAQGVRHILFLWVEGPTAGKNRVHVDLAARLPQDEIERLVRLGASLIDQAVDGEPRWREGNGIKWVVLRDPEGNEFCIGAIPVQVPVGGTHNVAPNVGLDRRRVPCDRRLCVHRTWLPPRTDRPVRLVGCR